MLPESVDPQQRLAQLSQLIAIVSLRERRLWQAYQDGDAALRRLEAARDEQRSIVDTLQSSVDSLRTYRLQRPPSSAAALLAAAERSRVLHAALEKERFYLDVADEDCRVALRKCLLAHRRWWRQRSLSDRLGSEQHQADRASQRRDQRRVQRAADELAGHAAGPHG